MMPVQRAAFAQRYSRERALGGVGRLADRLRHFARLAVAKAGSALLIADDDKCGKAEAPPTLDDLGNAIDVHELVDELAIALCGSSVAWFTGHIWVPCCRSYPFAVS
jgi:hypothetical protein